MRRATCCSVVVICMLLLGGCANLNTVGRVSSLPNDGKAVHLDAAQRVTVSNNRGWVCAEPSPDALQAYASSLGAGSGTLTKESVSLAQALSASSGSIGLRTQSITLMRDALYRICELHFNGALTKEEVVQLLKRSQDLSLGVLAIEQLTGAVVAQQVVLNTNSTAAAAATINDTQKELDRAKADEDAKKKAADTAASDLEAQKKTVASKTAESAAAKEKAKPIQAEIDRLTPELKKATDGLEVAIGNRVTLKSAVVGQEAIAKRLTTKREAAGKQVVAHGEVVLATQNALNSATTAVPKDQKKIDELTLKLKAAQEAETRTKSELAALETDLTKAQDDLRRAKEVAAATDKPVDAAQAQVDKLNAQLVALRAEDVQAAADKSATALKTASDDLKKMETAADDTKKALEKAQANTKEIEKLGNAATTSASASGGGTGQLSTLSSRPGVSKDTVEALARATTDIVQTIVYKGHLTDSCSALLVSHASRTTSSADADAAFARVLPLCEEVIKATLSVYRARGAATSSAAPLQPLGQPGASQ